MTMAELFEFYALLLNVLSYTLLALLRTFTLLFALDSLDWAEMILQWRDKRIRPRRARRTAIPLTQIG